MISERATLLYAAKREGIIKSNAHFWREYSSADYFYGHNISLRKLPQALMLQILNSAKYFHFRVI